MEVDMQIKKIIFSASSSKKKPEEKAIPAVPSFSVPQPAYQPKTQEPGNNFEKVIGLEERKNESFSPSPSTQRVVNLKELEKERPYHPNTQSQAKNLLNIKELINISKEESRATPQKTFLEPKNNISLSAADNSISHDYFASLKKTSQTNNINEPFNKTRRNLFELNNNAPNNLASSLPIKDFSQAKKADLQFSSPQKLSYEKEQEEIEKKPVISEKPQPSQISTMQPYRIRPSSFEDN